MPNPRPDLQEDYDSEEDIYAAEEEEKKPQGIKDRLLWETSQVENNPGTAYRTAVYEVKKPSRLAKLVSSKKVIAAVSLVAGLTATKVYSAVSDAVKESSMKNVRTEVKTGFDFIAKSVPKTGTGGDSGSSNPGEVK